MNIPELNKPAGTTCRLASKIGCKIYSIRPQVCRNFSCLWLLGELPAWAKPDKIGSMAALFSSDQTTVVLMSDDEAAQRRGIKALEVGGWTGRVEVWQRSAVMVSHV